MKPSLRFLALAVIGWVGVRAAMLGTLPGAEMFHIQPRAARAPPIVPTQFPAIDAVEPIEPAMPMMPGEAPMAQPLTASAGPAALRYVQGIVGVPVPMRPGVVTVYQLPPPTAAAAEIPPRAGPFGSGWQMPDRSDYYSVLPPLDESLLSRTASLAGPSSSPVIVPTGDAVPVDPRRLDRIQLAAWAVLRSQQTGVAGSRSLASGGQLGASQAGARLIYNIDRRISVAARTSSEVGRRGGEVAAGVRVQPLVSIPVWITAERRQALGRYGGGRNAFALFAEGGVYERPLPWRFTLDGYAQGGIVGMRSHDWFVDGGVWVTRPVYRNFSAGFGVWGGAQPHLYRVDAGPRVTMRVRKNVKVHLDWRQRLAGNARPGSGPALTLAADF
jgi:hypothetical protein